MFRSGFVLCMGFVIPFVFCIIIVAGDQNIWIITLMIILLIIIIASLILLSYGEKKLIKPYLNKEDVIFAQILRDNTNELQNLICGYYRDSLKNVQFLILPN